MLNSLLKKGTGPLETSLRHQEIERSDSDNPLFQQTLKLCAGAVLSSLFREKTLKIEQGFTMPYFASDADMGLAGRLIRLYVANRSRRNGTGIESLHKRFWQRQRPDDWFATTADRLERLYIPIFEGFVDQVQSHLITTPIKTVIEFGCGTGQWLAFLKSKWPHVERFVGIDLAGQQITINQQLYPEIDFQHQDLMAWVDDAGTQNSLFVTHCGVLEYLSEKSLTELFSAIAEKHRGSMLMLIEPIAEDFDFVREQKSRLQGTEFSFAHNYPQLLRSANHQIVLQTEKRLEDFRMLCLLARTGSVG